MKSKINSLLQKTTGYILTKGKEDKVSVLFRSKWFEVLNIRSVIDVGANSGQFAKSVRSAIPDADIISFEPIPKEAERLKRDFAKDSHFKLFQYALGNENATVPFEVNEFSPTSSLLSHTNLQKEYYPITGKTNKIEVEVKRLDEVIKSNELKPNILLKIDVQGFEDKVILGAEKLLPSVAIIYVECSFKKFYENQPLFNDIYQLLLKYNFEFRGIGDSLHSGQKNEPVQVDAIFINSSLRA